ncbi:MAG: recombinase family protein [Proteobacteria bacterium]|nr:recombinase family protein [Pseudomonadota bacterium]
MGKKKSPKAAIYARVSTTGNGQDVGLQLDELRQVARQRGWKVVNEYVDDGVSGAKETRPQLDQLMGDARRGKIDLVAVWKLDRLGRSLAHLLRLLDELAALGVGFVSVRDSGMDTTSPTGRLMLQILGAFAEFERAMIQERVVAGVRRAQAAGKHCGRPKVDMDLRPALALLDQGRGLKQVATILGVSRSTLRRRLEDQGHWPRPAATSQAERIP